MKTSHTPGPTLTGWVLRGGDDDDGYEIVCDLEHDGALYSNVAERIPAEYASLLFAAPDLLAALVEAEDMLRTAMRYDLPGFKAAERKRMIDKNPGMAMIRAAIRKARGES